MSSIDSEKERTNELKIRTPEGVIFSLPLAGPLSRFLALIIDIAAASSLTKLLSVLVKFMGGVSYDLSQALSILLYFAVSIGYAIILEWYLNGQTLGKRVLGLKVMDIQGLGLKPSQIIIRNLLRAVDSLPVFYLTGGLVCLISRHCQRLGDLAANTIVIRVSKAMVPTIDNILEQNQHNSLRRYPHLVARLRQSVSVKEADIALQTLLRRDVLASTARVSLFAVMAAHFKGKVEFPPEALDGISDEQYVRNVVDLIFR